MDIFARRQLPVSVKFLVLLGSSWKAYRLLSRCLTCSSWPVPKKQTSPTFRHWTRPRTSHTVFHGCPFPPTQHSDKLSDHVLDNNELHAKSSTSVFGHMPPLSRNESVVLGDGKRSDGYCRFFNGSIEELLVATGRFHDLYL